MQFIDWGGDASSSRSSAARQHGRSQRGRSRLAGLPSEDAGDRLPMMLLDKPNLLRWQDAWDRQWPASRERM